MYKVLLMNNGLLFLILNISLFFHPSAYCADNQKPITIIDTIGKRSTHHELQDRMCWEYNKDAKGHLFGVMDGHGGDAHVADCMSREFPKLFFGNVEKFLSEKCVSPEKKAFEQSFAAMEIHALENFKSGSTGLFVFLKEHEKQIIAHIAHVGDSRAVCGSGRSCLFATQDHSLKQEDERFKREDERDRIVNAGGIIYRYNNGIDTPRPWRINTLSLTRSIGDRLFKGKSLISEEITVSSTREIKSGDKKTLIYLEQWENIPQNVALVITPQEGQIIAEPEYMEQHLTDLHRWLILASDGFWDVIDNKKALQKVQFYRKQKGSVSGVTKSLCDYAVKQGSADDITIIVVDLLNLRENFHDIDFGNDKFSLVEEK